MVKLIICAAIAFLLFCWVTAIANTFAKEKRITFDLAEKKFQLKERVFFFIVFVVLSAMIVGLFYILFFGGIA